MRLKQTGQMWAFSKL